MLAFCLLLVRHEDVIGLRVDNVAAVDDFLPALYKTCGQWNAAMKLVETRLTAVLVVGEVWRNVVVEVALAQDVAVGGKGLVEENLLIG